MLDFEWFEDQALNMIDISFTPEQKTALEALHTKTLYKSEGDRINAVLLSGGRWLIAKALRKR
jgi:hypothetical protein